MNVKKINWERITMDKKQRKFIIPLSIVGVGVGLTYFLFRDQPDKARLAAEKMERLGESNHEQKDFFLMVDDGLPLAVTITKPIGKQIKGIVQVIHGILEHKNRYQDFADFLAAQGYLVLTSDNRGHGESNNEQNPLGHMPGVERMVADQVYLTNFIKAQYPDVPLYLYGHSFGSILARNYLKENDDLIDKLLLTGTVSYEKLAPLGIQLAKIAQRLTGKEKHSWLLKKLSGYGAEDKSWLTNDLSQIEKLNGDTQIIPGYTNQGVSTIWQADYELKQIKKYRCQNPMLPILSLSGMEDEAITGGLSGLADTKSTLEAIGYQHVEVFEYEGMKHEVINEINNQLVYQRILEFFEA